MAESPLLEPVGFETPISLWRLVEQNVPEHERGEVRNMLGESLIDQSLELHDEIAALLEIWRNYREESLYVKDEPKNLPEPPLVRERLIQEIKFFVENVQEKARSRGILTSGKGLKPHIQDEDKILSRHNTDIIDYALDLGRPSSSRPQSVLGRDGRETPAMSTPNSDRLSLASTLSEDIESMNDKFTFLRFDEVVQHLRETLEEEIEQLLSDVGFLQQCLEDETDSVLRQKEPSIAALREERAALEKELLSHELPHPEMGQNKPVFQPLKKLTDITQAETKLKQSVLSSPSGQSRSSPVKASHNVKPSQTIPNAIDTHLSGDRDTLGSSDYKCDTSIPKLHGAIRLRRRSISPTGGRIVQVETMHAEGGKICEMDSEAFVPSPPNSIKPSMKRPSSADKFRRMVIGCREPAS